MLAEMEVMHEYVGKLSGNLSIGGLCTIMGDYLPALFRAYREKVGDAVKMEVSQGFSLPLIEGLKEDKYDVIFAAKKSGEPQLCFDSVVSHQLVVGVRKGSPLSARNVVSLEELRGYNVYTYRTGTPIGDEVNKVLSSHGLPAHQEFDDEITMGGMLSTARMDECALLTYTIGLKPFLDDIDIISIDPHEVPVDFHHVYMVYKKEEFKNRALESFVEFTSSFIPPESVVLRCSGKGN